MKWRGVMCATLSNIGRNSYKDHWTIDIGLHIYVVMIVFIVLDAIQRNEAKNSMGFQSFVPHATRSGPASLAVRVF